MHIPVINALASIYENDYDSIVLVAPSFEEIKNSFNELLTPLSNQSKIGKF